MAKLNLNKKKLINEDNLRAIISYGLGFASRVKTLEDKEIAPFEADKMYLKDSLCIYNDYIYMAKVTNQSATFNENYWTLLGDDITELSKTDIEAMLGLTTEEIETLSKIILDTEVELSKTWSSSKIYTDIQNAIDTSKAYTLAELSKISGATYKVVSATSEITDEKIIYLLDNSGVFDMYIVDGGIPTKIGDTNIDLSDYYTKTEVDNDFLKKTDATSTYATITTVDEKVDKTNILSATSSTATDEHLYSAKVVNDELDKKANTDEVVKKTDIVTTIDSTSTDEQIPSAKTIYDNAFVYRKVSNIDCEEGSWVTQFVEIPTSENGTFPLNDGGGWLKIEQIKAKDFLHQICTCHTADGSFRGIYVRHAWCNATKIENVSWSSWRKICTTRVADVPRTFMPLPDGNSGELSYIIKNGFATITVFNLAIATSPLVVTGLPIPATYVANPVVSADGTNVSGSICYSDNDKFVIYGTPGIGMYGVVTYPIAE